MVVVFVWEQRLFKEGSFGHASMNVGGEYIGGRPSGGDYISWWPERRMHLTSPAIMGRQFADDEASERRLPALDHVIKIRGLDEAAIKTWWARFRTEGHQWEVYNQSCAQTVAFALRAGGGDRFVRGASGWWRSWNTVWSPNDVLLYATAIQAGIAATNG